ncbi:MAG: 16S rRNA (cytosine1402-N4)-methyltransferase [Lentimonas sp.]|jgi:16S rRNA (cytosine1402-N4)-methyltransferase
MTANNYEYHLPVMLDACIEGLNINPDGVYIDVTFGGGGHARELFSKLSSKGKLIVFDQDPDAQKNAWEAPNFQFIASNFSFISNHLRILGIKQVDGILADFGVSSHQFDAGERGFSIRNDAPLDMRMNQNNPKSAREVVNEYDQENLMRIMGAYGEVKSPRKIAEAILLARQNKTIETTGELMEVLSSLAPKFKEHKFFAQVFQGIRIEVNEELKVIETLLLQLQTILKPGGRFVAMSYHSLEDRLVKNFLKRGSLEGKIEKDFFGNVLKPFNEITRHPVVADEEEIAANPRARSAKLRIAERNEQ